MRLLKTRLGNSDRAAVAEPFRRPIAIVRRFAVALFSLPAWFALGPALFAQTQLTPLNPLESPNTAQTPNSVALFPNSYTFGTLPFGAAAGQYSPVATTTYTSPFAGDFTGQVVTTVYQQNVTGNLAFQYQFFNVSPLSGPQNDIAHVGINGTTNTWANYTIYAGADGLGSSSYPTSPNSASSWTDGNPFYIEESALDNGIGIQFASSIDGTLLNSQTNDKSADIWFATNATAYNLMNVSLSDTTAQGTAMALGPVGAPNFTPVPEPSTLALAACGAALVLAAGRRSRKAANRLRA